MYPIKILVNCLMDWFCINAEFYHINQPTKSLYYENKISNSFIYDSNNNGDICTDIR